MLALFLEKVEPVRGTKGELFRPFHEMMKIQGWMLHKFRPSHEISPVNLIG